MNNIPLESEEQCRFVSTFKEHYPNVKILAIPNGAHVSSARQAVKLKREGLLNGIPDLFVPQWKLWIEMKRQKGSYLSASQKEVISYLETCGYFVFVGYGFDDAWQKLQSFSISKNCCKPSLTSAFSS